MTLSKKVFSKIPQNG